MTMKKYTIKNPRDDNDARDLIEITHYRVIYHDGSAPNGRVIAYVPDAETAKMLKQMLTYRQEEIDKLR